jgi:TrmH RNA methyltransferase
MIALAGCSKPQRIMVAGSKSVAAAENGQPIASLRRGEKPFALILGNEGHGLTRATLNACDETVTVRGSGKVQSLNVAASAAILLQTLAR